MATHIPGRTVNYNSTYGVVFFVVSRSRIDLPATDVFYALVQTYIVPFYGSPVRYVCMCVCGTREYTDVA